MKIKMMPGKCHILFILISVTSQCWGSQPYIGLGVGPEFATFNQNATISKPGTYYVRDNTHLSGTGLEASLFAGDSFTRNRYYLAGELNVDVSNVKHQRFNDEFIHKVFSHLYYRMPYSYGISLLPGYQLTTNTLIYARIGYARGKLKVSSADISIPSFNRYLEGIAFGAGLNEKIRDNLSLRVEYKQINYQSTSVFTFDPLGNVTKHTNISPTTGLIELAIIYS